MTGALYRCPIIRCVPLSNAREHAQPVQEIVLEAPPGFSFRAGQYTQVEHLEGLIPLSIASGPRRLPTVTLHYRSLPGVPAARWMDELLAAGEPLLLHAPAGDVQMPDDSRQPIVMIVGGTGITQALAVLDELADVSERAPVDLLWCADSADDFYCRHALDALAASWLRVRYTVDPRRTPDNSAFEQARNLLSSSRTAAPWILLGGSPSFVYAMDEALATVTRTPRHADAFSWAPRPTQQDL